MNGVDLGFIENEIAENPEAYRDAIRDMMEDEEDDMQYEVGDEMIDRIESNFTYHNPNGDQAKRYGEIREAARSFALLISGLTPVSREQSLALTNLEQSVMWANASIARNEESS